MHGRPAALASIGLALLLAAAQPARADWFSEGVRVAASDTMQSDPVLASDGSGGAYIVWQDYRPGFSTLYAQHLTAEGSTASGWPGEGMQISTGLEYDPVVVADGRGGAFIAATNGGSVGLWHLFPGSPPSIVSVSRPAESAARARPAKTEKTSPTVLPVLLPDGSGGVFLAWEQGGRLSEYVEMQHFGFNGQVVAPWPASPLSLGYGNAPVICSDGAGGLFVAAWGVVVQHVAVRADTVLSDWPGWISVTPQPHPGQDAPGIVPDGAGGALIVWQDSRQASQQQLYAQRLDAAGAVATGWPASGLPVCLHPTDAGLTRYAAGGRTQRYSVIASDGTGGGFIAWRDMRADSGDVYLQHLLPDGSLAQGWTQDGVPVCRAPGIQTAPSIALDASGGTFVGWQDQRPGSPWRVYVQHMLASGVPDPRWPDHGAIACTGPSWSVLPRVISDGANGPLLAWQDGRFYEDAIFATHLKEDASLSPVGPCYVGVSVLSTVADSGMVRIAWQLTHADTLTATLYCRQIDGGWMPITRRRPDSAGRIDYADVEGIAGCRYGYALGIRPCDGPEQIQGVVWIDIPQGRGFPSLSAERSAASQDGRLQLSWRIPGGEGLTAIVSRRDSCSEWASLDTISIGQDEIVSYEDRSVFEGQSLCYRIGVHACGRDNVLSESWISIPAGRGFVGTAATLIRATADSAGAHLAWQMQSGPPSRAHIYRQDTSHAWALLQDYPMVPGETLEFVDRTVRASKRYEYCLGLWNCGVETRFGAAVVQTPAISRLSVPLALRGGWPNPTHSKLTVAFSLASADLARLDVFDAGGRMVMSRSVGSLGAGEHLLALEGSTLPLRPGLYIVRLSQGGRKLSARVVLLP